MNGRYPGAIWRPLSTNQTEPYIGTPRVLIWHTMVGNLRGTERMFRADGYTGTESHFGLGGKADAGLDGILWQWQDLRYQADAQNDGNAYATSIECSDGGNWRSEFTDAQVEASVRLGVWWCKNTGNPPRKVSSWNGYGFGYHKMFDQWTKGPRDCPGPARIIQLEKEIWPEIARRLLSVPKPVEPDTDVPVFPLPRGSYYGLRHNAGIPNPESGLKTWQRRMVERGWSLSVNGQFNERMDTVVRQFQSEKNLDVDGKIGQDTWKAAWTTSVI